MKADGHRRNISSIIDIGRSNEHMINVLYLILNFSEKEIVTLLCGRVFFGYLISYEILNYSHFIACFIEVQMYKQLNICALSEKYISCENHAPISLLTCTPRLLNRDAFPRSLNSTLINRRRHLRKKHSLEIYQFRYLPPKQQKGQKVG